VNPCCQTGFMSKPTPTRGCTTNGFSDTASLCKHGSLLIWLDKEMIWRASPEDKPVVLWCSGMRRSSSA
jgi:rhodanese-related sulfurtransferase